MSRAEFAHERPEPQRWVCRDAHCWRGCEPYCGPCIHAGDHERGSDCNVPCTLITPEPRFRGRCGWDDQI
jgi:hypothetical protein